MQAFPVNGKSVVCWNGLILGAAPVLLAVVPVFVVTRANISFGLAEGAAEFLPGTMIVGGFAILVHGETCFTDWIANGQLLRVLCITLIQRDDWFTLIGVFHQIVDSFHIVALITEKSALTERQNSISRAKNVRNHRCIGCVSRCGQFKERKAGDAVHQD